jgi:hypothetical protein
MMMRGEGGKTKSRYIGKRLTEGINLQQDVKSGRV